MSLFGNKNANTYELDKIEKQLNDAKKRYEELGRELTISLGTKSLSTSELKKYRKKVEELSTLDKKIKDLEKLKRTIGMSSLINKSK